MWCLSASVLRNTITDQLPPRGHTNYFAAGFVLLAGAFAFLLVDARRQELTRKARAGPPNGQYASSAYDNRGLPPPQGYH